ncbi:MAG TPA: arylsulfatase [Nevskiaceae bacterium]|nr:arylsulfatase [Nevskiaceae bacterium]
MSIRWVRAASAALLVLLTAGCGPSTPLSTAGAPDTIDRPNFLVILGDDIGYSDVGAFGSEIATPNLDRLAAEGRVLTNFHSTPLCATSRAELLTGADHHLVGVGTLAESAYFYPNNQAYAGQFDQGARTVAQLLRDAGYHTYMAGKWHLGSGGPAQWGFEHSFSLQYESAFASNFAVTADHPESAARDHYEDGELAQIPDDFFSSDYYTQKLIDYIGANHGDGVPFFGYLAFQAVHFPLQVPDAYLDRYTGRYDAGYSAIQQARLAKQKALGIIPQDFEPNPGDEATMIRFGQPGVLLNQPWDSLSAADQKSEARIMEIFAAMMTNLDDNVGKVFDYLKQIGEYDRTFIVFVSDNGPDGMGYGFIPYTDTQDPQSVFTIDNSMQNYGRPSSFLFRSTRWAEVGATPFRLFKGFTQEGGIGVPAIVRLPGASQGAPSGALSSLRDVVPTMLDLAGIPDPGATYQDHDVAPIEGKSLVPVLTGAASEVHADDEPIADEVNDIRYIRKGPWKMTRVVNYMLPSAAELIDHDWQLYNVADDRGENHDLAATNPDKVAELLADWQAYVARVGAVNPVAPPILTPMDQ